MMRNLLLVLALGAFFMSGCSQSDEMTNGQSFGNGVSLAKTMTVPEVLNQAQAMKGQTLRMQGTVANVCPDEGCRIEMIDGDRIITVRFKDDAFRAPKDVAGKTVEVEGVFLANSGDIKCADAAEGKTCPEEAKLKDKVFSGGEAGCCEANAKRINYNFIASGMVVL